MKIYFDLCAIQRPLDTVDQIRIILEKEMKFITEKEKSRALEFLIFGIKPLDALHLALAESGQADYFCTCDDNILKKSKQIIDLEVKVLSPVDLVQEIEK
ncbi:MAG: hypothetical protein CVU41_09875 [Chloroflexi bacterium HGW-Chloroflexi-3]|nr:MAG: hypothetical protein CVU41_09875 [Chloroflexi bacterium HGW-Chloroflexi-3]